jgi:hypothetical protein
VDNSGYKSLVGENGGKWVILGEKYAPHTQLTTLKIFAKVVFIKNYKMSGQTVSRWSVVQYY